LSAIAVGLAADAANAQPDIATDHELLAAYCLGAANAVARQPTGVAQLDTMIEQDHQAKLVRLRAYLGAKGYLPTRRPRKASCFLPGAARPTKSGAALASLPACRSVPGSPMPVR
jgi:hypothetical protein